MDTKQQLLDWIDAHFDEEVAFLQSVVRIPADTPPGNNAPHAQAIAAMLEDVYGCPVCPALPSDSAIRTSFTNSAR